MKIQPIATLREAARRMHQLACNAPGATGYMSIPPDFDRDADLLISCALDELSGRRESELLLRDAIMKLLRVVDEPSTRQPVQDIATRSAVQDARAALAAGPGARSNPNALEALPVPPATGYFRQGGVYFNSITGEALPPPVIEVPSLAALTAELEAEKRANAALRAELEAALKIDPTKQAAEIAAAVAKRTFDRFQDQSRRTLENPEMREWLGNFDDDGRLYDAMAKLAVATGVAGEAGEVADLVKKDVWHRKTTGVERLKEEVGDLLWYIAAVATLYGFNLGDAAEANVAKLRGRFPEGFSFKAAADRADEKVAPVCTCPPLSGYERPELTGHSRGCPVWASRPDEGGTK